MAAIQEEGEDFPWRVSETSDLGSLIRSDT